jgi:hypothetical protein
MNTQCSKPAKLVDHLRRMRIKPNGWCPLVGVHPALNARASNAIVTGCHVAKLQKLNDRLATERMVQVFPK